MHITHVCDYVVKTYIIYAYLHMYVLML